MGILERFSLAGRTALVTGAGQGIGQAYALALAEAGAAVAVVDINPATAQQTTEAILAQGGCALAIEADVTRKAEVERMVAAVVTAWGRLDIGVNNAGIGRWAKGEEMSEADWDAVIDLNLKAAFLCCQAEGV